MKLNDSNLFRQQALINGEWLDANNGEAIDVTNPANGDKLGSVPKMGADMRNQAKRFVALVDALYETRTKLIISAEVEPQDLYPAGDGSFEFERTVSRLIEMRSEDYLAEARAVPEG